MYSLDLESSDSYKHQFSQYLYAACMTPAEMKNMPAKLCLGAFAINFNP